MRVAWIVVAGLALALSAGCGGEQAPADSVPSAKATVVVSDGAYIPARVRVAAGDRVTFVGRSVAPNTVETDGVGFFEYDRELLDRQNRFDLHVISPGEAETWEFDTPGRYDFHSSLDPTMHGTVEVVEPD